MVFESHYTQLYPPPLSFRSPPKRGVLLLPETWGPEAEKDAAAEVHATCHRVPGRRFKTWSVGDPVNAPDIK